MFEENQAASAKTRAHRCLLALVLFVLAISAGPASAALPQSSEEEPYQGLSLTQALTRLRSAGLRLVFTSEVVRVDMRVESEPQGPSPRQILDQILSPHRLEAVDGPRNSLVVVRRADPESQQTVVAGFVESRPDAAPVSGATVRILESGFEAVTDANGAFSIPDHPAGTFSVEIGRVGFAVERVDGFTVRSGMRNNLRVTLDPAPILEEQLIISPSRVSLLRQDPIGPLSIGRDEILALPHLGDDFFRALSLLPGVSSKEVTAEFHVRGARRNETQILLDGQELYEAYHLKDFDNALSFVASSSLASADLQTGGFSAEYGDRMAGVLDMTTVRPTGATTFRLGIGVLNAHAGGAGTFQNERGAWLVKARRGTIDLASRLLGNEDPSYWDAYAKLEYQLNGNNHLRVNLLFSGDDLNFQELDKDGSTKDNITEYDSGYAWITHQALLSSKMFFETAVSATKIDRDRNGIETDEDVEFVVHDLRGTEILSVRQAWNLQASERHLLRWGFDLRRFDTEYDYLSMHEFSSVLSEIRHMEEDVLFAERFEEEHNGVYVTDRFRLADPLTLEVGLRYDRYSQTEETFLAPRVNLAWAPSRNNLFRISWGRFNQSQRTYELEVADGETSLHPVEQSEHRIIGYEHIFERASGNHLAFRAEAYQREVENPRPRYENLYEALNTFPEVEPDRVRIDPDHSQAEGVEFFLRGRASKRVSWFVNYAWAKTEDRIDGVDIPRQFDQRHAFNLDIDYLLGENWRLNLAWRYHSGWPTTPLSVAVEEDDEGELEFVPELGELYSERLAAYHRLDLRASRSWKLRSGTLELFIDIQNLYNRKNIAGFDIEIDDEDGTTEFFVEYWAGILPSAGISFEF